MEITKSEYDQCIKDEAGFCTECDCFTVYGIEPDDAYYSCDVCNNDGTVFGVDAAIGLEFVFKQAENSNGANILLNKG